MKYIVIDRQTGLQVGRSFVISSKAYAKRDRLDNAYGAYRYYVKGIEA